MKAARCREGEQSKPAPWCLGLRQCGQPWMAAVHTLPLLLCTAPPTPQPQCSQLRREQVKQGSPGPEGQDILHSGEGPSGATWDHDCPERCWIMGGGGRSCSPCPPCPHPPGSSWYLGLKSTLQGSKGAWVWEQGGQSWDGRREGREKLQEKAGGVFQGPRRALGHPGQGHWAWPSGPHPATPALGGRLHRPGAA